MRIHIYIICIYILYTVHNIDLYIDIFMLMTAGVSWTWHVMAAPHVLAQVLLQLYRGKVDASGRGFKDHQSGKIEAFKSLEKSWKAWWSNAVMRCQENRCLLCAFFGRALKISRGIDRTAGNLSQAAKTDRSFRVTTDVYTTNAAKLWRKENCSSTMFHL